MQRKTQHQYPDQNIVRSSTPRHVSSQNATTRQKTQLQEPAEKTSMLLCLARASQQVSYAMQIIVGVIAALIVAGIITLFILAAIVPNAYIGIAALLSSIGTLIGGFLAGKATGKHH